jgi:hypothetical protein
MPTTNDPIIIDCPECCPEGIILVDRCDCRWLEVDPPADVA